ncbi:MAG: IS1595 family transposase [Rhodobacteraceae bacterium]|nr:IS1595 family transposase [Paracoccaceae bacterium]
MSILSAEHFHNEEAAYAWVEARLWPNGPVCPKCGETHRVGKLTGKSTRIGVHKCYKCRKPFTVKVGTIFESSHVPLRFWLQAIHLIASSKKGISSNQIHRTLGVTLKTAWFLGHRIREAMRAGSFTAPLGGNGSSGVVEADETFIGRKKGVKKPKGGTSHKHAVLSLVERGGDVRSVHVPDVTARTVVPIVNGNIAKEARVMTDNAATYYQKLAAASHETVNHGDGEYVRGDVHTNTVEGYFSIFKRGMKGVYQHCDEKHLHRYLAEFDFRYNNRVARGVDDSERAERILRGVKGKRLTYRTVDEEVTHG